MILVDTSVWSLAFRRRSKEAQEPAAVGVLRGLIEADHEVCLPGIVLQEMLSGIREIAQVQLLQTILAGFPLILATGKTHVEAARIANACRRQGVTSATVDCLIAALAIEHDAQLLTTDKDFVHMAQHCPLRLCGDCAI